MESKYLFLIVAIVALCAACSVTIQIQKNNNNSEQMNNNTSSSSVDSTHVKLENLLGE